MFYSLASVACAASVVPVTIVVVVVNGVVDVVVAVPPEVGPICKSMRYIRLADIVTISQIDTDDDDGKQHNRPHQTKPKQKQ